MRFAIIGCGYVADFYMTTLANHPELRLVGVMDRDTARLQTFAGFHGIATTYRTLQDVLRDDRVECILNLTNPGSHYEVSKAALLAGKHVYSEKPLGLRFEEAEELVALAESRGLGLSAAPCSVLGEAAQTTWKALRDGKIGQPRLAYAELDDGPVPLMDYRGWKSASGSPWPYKDEFEVGCTLEHAGYYVTWLIAFFGAAKRVTSYAALTVPDKGVVLDRETPDFTVACIEFASGVVARITCSIFASHDHQLRVFGDAGVLRVADCWDYGSQVTLSRRNRIGLKAEKHPLAAKLTGLGGRSVPLLRKPTFAFKTRGANRMDFARGVAELAAAVGERRQSRISARYALHVNELVLAMQDPKATPHDMRSSCDPMTPMPWARA